VEKLYRSDFDRELLLITDFSNLVEVKGLALGFQPWKCRDVSVDDY
jgi:hypothetical protein